MSDIPAELRSKLTLRYMADCKCGKCAIVPDELIERAAAEIERLKDLTCRLRQEAQGHAGEARAANHTIYEIYQCVSRARGEPGNWNGAKPVVDEIERLRGAQ